MRALTVCQPFAEMIANGEKPIENRAWPTAFRGPLAIHAGKSHDWMVEGDELVYPSMVFGAVIAIATLVDCIAVEKLPTHLANNDHANGPWCFILRDVRRVTPVPYRGAQGFWEFPDRLVEQRTGMEKSA